MKKRGLLPALILTLLVFITLAVAHADEDDDNNTPASSVARVSLVRGDVSLLRGDSGDWVAAAVNTPLVIGDTLATGEDSRAEVELDDAHVLRLDENAQVKIANLTSSNIQLQLAQGRVNFVTLRSSAADAEIDTPSVAVHPTARGVYRIEVNSDTETLLTVRRGEAEVSTPEGGETVSAGQLITIRGTDDPEYQIVDAPTRDAWDEWNDARDREILEARSWHYADPAYTGASDLDRYGQWVQVPGYEWCWTPYVNLGWIPYSYGRWVWEPYWGWTWVSYEPWGWAPYHYGRWFLWGGSWVWWPGPQQPALRPVWAPAYVAFFGFGFGGRSWSFGSGFGYQTMGWLPVGPSDFCYPWWGARHTYRVVNITNIANVTNITNISNIQGHAISPLTTARQPVISNLQGVMNDVRVRQAIVTVLTQDFEKGSVPRNPRPVDAAMLREAQLVQGTLPAVPERESLRPADRPATPILSRAQSTANPHFFSKTVPPAGPQPFSEHAAEIRQMVQQRHPAEPGVLKPAAPPAASASREAGPTERAPNGQPTEAQWTPPAPDQKPGWRHFGQTPATKVSGSATGRSDSAEPARHVNPPLEKANVRQEDLPAAEAEPSAESRRSREAPTSGEQKGAREPGKPEGAAEEPARSGWHRFGEEGSKSQGSKSEPKPERSKPSDSETKRQDQSRKT